MNQLHAWALEHSKDRLEPDIRRLRQKLLRQAEAAEVARQIHEKAEKRATTTARQVLDRIR